ncbi:MAG: hypothetical protein V1870_01425 [Candidatus Aenigmatarchaeota archaeon]
MAFTYVISKKADDMKKQTQKVIMTIIIVLLLGASTIAFVVVGGSEDKPQEIGPPEKQILNGYLNETLKEVYLQRGYSLMEYHYYIGCCKKIDPFIDYLPESVDNQLIIQKIEDSEYFISLESIAGKEEKITPVDQSELLNSLCKVLVKSPMECGLLMMNQTDKTNTVAEVNTTNTTV